MNSEELATIAKQIGSTLPMPTEIQEDFSGFIRRSLEATSRITLPCYTKVVRSRTALEARVAAIFERIDVLLTPTTAIPAHVAEGPPPATI